MKLTKVAAVVAGSVAALGASTTAFAAEPPATMPPMSLTSGATEALNAVGPFTESAPQTAGNALAEQGEGLNKAVETVQRVNQVRNEVPGTVLGLANGATRTSPLLGGVKLNGGQG